MPAIRSVSVFYTSNGLFNESLIKSAISIKSMVASTVSKTKVLLRVLLSRGSGRSATSWESLSPDLKTRIFSQTNGSQLKKSSNFNKLFNRLLNGHKVLINRLILKNESNPKIIVGSTGLSLGLVGVCVKRDVPSLITDTDLIESNCQEIRNIFYSYREFEFKSKLLNTKDLFLENIEFGSCIGKGFVMESYIRLN